MTSILTSLFNPNTSFLPTTPILSDLLIFTAGTAGVLCMGSLFLSISVLDVFLFPAMTAILNSKGSKYRTLDETNSKINLFMTLGVCASGVVALFGATRMVIDVVAMGLNCISWYFRTVNN
jgi:hypothetical protein